MFHVDQPALMPKVHLRVFSDSFFNIPLDKEALVNATHVFYGLCDIERRGQGDQGLDLLDRFRPQEVAHQVVAAEGSAHHVDLGVGVPLGDCL